MCVRRSPDRTRSRPPCNALRRRAAHGRARKRVTFTRLIASALLSGGCAHDPGGLTAPPVAAHGTLVVAVTTTGDDVGMDGYLVIGTDGDSARVASTGSVVLSGLAAGPRRVALAAIPGNCIVDGASSRDVSVAAEVDTRVVFAVRCVSWASLPAGVAAVVGEWRARSWEFLTVPDAPPTTAPPVDLVAMGVSGILKLSRTGGADLRWDWRETYRWWGPNAATVFAGRARAVINILDAVTESVESPFDCDLGDCDGPLHGSYTVARDGDVLVLTSAAQVGFYYVTGPDLRWSRLTLERVR